MLLSLFLESYSCLHVIYDTIYTLKLLLLYSYLIYSTRMHVLISVTQWASQKVTTVSTYHYSKSLPEYLVEIVNIYIQYLLDQESRMNE